MDTDPEFELSGREREIQSRLATKSDRAIAAEIGLKSSGVRYHPRKLFAELGAGSGKEAVQLAREKGLLP